MKMKTKEDYEWLVDLIQTIEDEISKTILRRLLATWVEQEGQIGELP
jgi:hypothetical protein